MGQIGAQTRTRNGPGAGSSAPAGSFRARAEITTGTTGMAARAAAVNAPLLKPL